MNNEFLLDVYFLHFPLIRLFKLHIIYFFLLFYVYQLLYILLVSMLSFQNVFFAALVIAVILSHFPLCHILHCII